MPTRPTDVIEFGTTGLTAEPILAKKQEGWLVGKRLPARWLNWFMRAYYRWIVYIDGTLGLDSHLTASIAGDSSATRETLTVTASATNKGAIVATAAAGTGTGVAATGGNSSGTGVSATGGAVSGYGIQATGGSPNGSAIGGLGTGTGSGVAATGGSSGVGVLGIAGTTGNAGIVGWGPSTGLGGTSVTATGTGVQGVGSATAAGVEGRGGTTAGPGGRFTGGTGDGHGVIATGDSTTSGGNGVVGQGGLGGAGISGTGGPSSGAIGVKGTGGSSNGIGVKGIGVGTGHGVYGLGADTGASGFGVKAENTAGGYALVVLGDTTSPVRAAMRITPADAQPTGASVVGDMYVTAAGSLVMCTVAGTPGTWVACALVTSPTITTPVIAGLLDLTGASGGQVKFPAAQNASADVNTLDDYEEGTWTPTFALTSGSVTYNAQTGWYTKVGRHVSCGARIKLSAVSSPVNTATTIGGLPFSPNASFSGAAAVGYTVGFSSVTGQIAMRIGGGSVNINILNNGGSTELSAATNLSASSEIMFNIEYDI